MCVLPTFAQHSVSGVVSDKEGALQGVTVQVKGSSTGVNSGVDGKYTVQVSGDDAVLIFSYIGYVQQEITVGSRQVIDVTMVEEAIEFDEVVVVGYGVQKKTSLTGAVATVKPKDIRDIAASNLSNALAGRLAGVTIKQSSGGRPGNASNIVVRARGTWNNTDPLYVIDGVVRDANMFNMLSPLDIENISVLKDAAAATIYGARAANGVILVTTKKGETGKPVITYSGSVSVSTAFSVLPQRETAAQRIAWINDENREFIINPNSTSVPYNVNGFRYWPTIYRQDGSLINTNVFTPDEEEFYKSRGDYDMLEEAWNTPVTNTHSLSVSGGSENVRYFVSGNYYDETGVFKTLSYKKFSVRGSVETDIAHGLKAGLTLSLNNNENSSPPGVGENVEGLFYRIMAASALIPAKVNGKYVSNIVGANFSDHNPLAIVDGAVGSEKKTLHSSDYIASLEWNVPWVKGLNLKTSFNQIWNNTFDKTWNTPYTVYELKLSGTNNHIVTDEFTGGSTVIGGKSSLKEEYSNSRSYQLNGFITYNNTFAQKHEVGLMLGFEQSEGFGEGFNAEKGNYDINKPYFDFGTSDKQYYNIGGKGWEDARLSYLGRLNYAFDSRYLLELSFRRDASVKFAPAHRWGFFPSASAAWRVSEEKFFKDNVSFITQLKLRGSYGLTGNDAVGAWQWLDGISSTTGMFYGSSSLTNGVAIGSIANPNITWEKSQNLDVGIDAGFLNNMFTLGAGYFHRHTYDILGSQTGNLPDTFGGNLADSNYGIVNSFGIEVEFGFNKRLTKDIDVWARGNFGWADNKLVEWAETGVPAHLSRIGKNWDRMYGFESDGVIWDMTPNGDGTYNITTSTGGEYVIPHDYAEARGTYDIEGQNNHAIRPGFVHIKDLGSASTDEVGTTTYLSTPDGRITDGWEDRKWIVEHINPPYNYGLLLGGSWKGIALEVFLQGTAGNMANINHPYDISGEWYGASFGHWSANHFSFENNPHGTMPAPSNFSGYYTIGWDSKNSHSFWMRSASFIRLKMVSLSYTVDKRLLSKIGVSGARIYLTGNNLALLYNPLKEFDPEVAVNTNNLNGFLGGYSTAIGVYPLLRSFTFGLELSF
jgi:TonB-linked SusC/RagA family outer membrane protein